MSSFQVPSPPVPSFKNSKRAGRANKTAASDFEIAQFAPRHAVLLDGAFLKRVYRANLWFGALLSISLGLIGLPAGLSCAAGVVTGLLFLKTQELFVARLLRSKTGLKISNSVSWLPTWALVPGKYVLLIAAILLMQRAGLLNYVGFTVGCLAVQLIMLSMAMGRMLSRRTKGQTTGRMLREIYVAPQKTKN